MNFETSDIVLASALKVQGCKLVDIKKEGNRGTFCFAEVHQGALDAFNLGQMLVEPVTFNNALKALTTAVRRIN